MRPTDDDLDFGEFDEFDEHMRATRRARHASQARAPAGRLHMLLLALLAPLALATVAGLVLLWPSGPLPPVAAGTGGPAELVDATVLDLTTVACRGTQLADGVLCQRTKTELTGGKQAGQEVQLEVPIGGDNFTLHQGDKVVLGYEPENAETERYVVIDYQRRTPMLVLGALFVGCVLALGRFKGVRALAGLAISLAAILFFLLPAILAGANPLLVALVGASVISFVALYVAHGFGVQTTVALLGTLASLALAGVLAYVFTGATRLTGLALEDALFLRVGGGQVNLRGLLLAGMILGTLGVLDDVTVTQVSAVWQLRRANPQLGAGGLYTAAVTVGRDHIASTVNTLVLAYAGASLPLLLFFRQANRALGAVLTSEVIAIEVVRTLVGSIGLVAAVPITTALAALIAARGDPAAVGTGIGHTH
jgi:uncharacterized membrane protein